MEYSLTIVEVEITFTSADYETQGGLDNRNIHISEGYFMRPTPMFWYCGAMKIIMFFPIFWVALGE